MSFWGTQGPKVQLLKWSGAVQETMTFPQPQQRTSNPWVREHDDRTNPITKKIIKRTFGHRYISRFYWSNMESGNDDLENLIKLINTNAPMRLFPHADNSINVIVKLTDYRIGYHPSNVNINEIEVEFKSEELLGKIPNPDDAIVISIRKIIDPLT